jgi:hypothetical protein
MYEKLNFRIYNVMLVVKLYWLHKEKCMPCIMASENNANCAMHALTMNIAQLYGIFYRISYFGKIKDKIYLFL